MKDFDKHCMDYPKVYMEIKKKKKQAILGYVLFTKNNTL